MTKDDATAGQLRVKILPVDSLRENVVFLSRRCQALRPERQVGSRKVEVSVGSRSVLASLLIVDDATLVGDSEIGLSSPACARLNASAGDFARVAPAQTPASMDHVRGKIRGETLGDAGLAEIVADLARHRYSDMEVAAFLIASASFMTAEEVLSLTKAMADAGARLSWPRETVVDKHCIGGIPGNRTTLIVAPIVAAHGLLMPKTSSRAITSPAGTADTMEVLARVDLGADEMRSVVGRCGACIVWGGHVNLSPADDVLISVERPLGVDTPGQMVASILSKKMAAGSTHLLVDMPVGPTAKIRSADHAHEIRKLFEFVGARVGVNVEVLMTDGSAPVGRGVGPVFEARDALQVLDGADAAPTDLAEKAIAIACRLLEFDPDVRGGQGAARARELLQSGRAREKMAHITDAQGAPPRVAKPGSRVREIVSRQTGEVRAIDCFRIARLARFAGAPTDPGAGIDLLKGVGDHVRAGEPLFRLHGEEASDFAFAEAAALDDNGVTVS
jgi:thymidine phosphorylase